MGAATSKLAVQERFNALSQRNDIKEDDEIWESMLSATSTNSELTDSEFFGMVNVDEIRRIWILQPQNFKNLFEKTTDKLEGLARVNMVGSNGTVALQICNCCRIITRMSPIIFESGASSQFNEHLPKAIQTLRRLLHFKGFTIPLTPRPGPVWNEGIGCPMVDRDSSKYTNNRVETLRALLSILSSPLYSDNKNELEYFTTTTKDPVIICSLLNTAVTKSNTELGTLSELLLTISSTHLAKKKNQIRRFTARLQNDFDWLSTKIKHHYETNDDKIIVLNLLWEIVQANPEFAASGGALVKLAELFVDEISVEIRKADISQCTRLRCFLLLSMTAESSFCAQAIAPKVLMLLVANLDRMSNPSIELATLIDILWNCAPSLVLTDTEKQGFMKLQNCVQQTNITVSMVIKSIHKVMQTLNPSLKTEESGECTEWSPIKFQWDRTRFRWYQSIQWGQAYQAEPRIWGRTHVKLFKVAEQRSTNLEIATSLIIR